MTTKAEFNAEEWETIVNGPPIAGMIVVVAEHGGSLRETFKIGKVYEEAHQAHMGPELIDELIASPPDPDHFRDATELHEKGLQLLRDAIATLDGRVTEDELDSYRGFVMGIAERVAHAHKSGGFLGIGGQEVSANEQLALDEVREAIGAHPVPDSEEE